MIVASYHSFGLKAGEKAAETLLAAELVINDVAELLQHERGQFRLGIVVSSEDDMGAAALN